MLQCHYVSYSSAISKNKSLPSTFYIQMLCFLRYVVPVVKWYLAITKGSSCNPFFLLEAVLLRWTNYFNYPTLNMFGIFPLFLACIWTLLVETSLIWNYIIQITINANNIEQNVNINRRLRIRLRGSKRACSAVIIIYK